MYSPVDRWMPSPLATNSTFRGGFLVLVETALMLIPFPIDHSLS